MISVPTRTPNFRSKIGKEITKRARIVTHARVKTHSKTKK